jgi:hypothetical protein
MIEGGKESLKQLSARRGENNQVIPGSSKGGEEKNRIEREEDTAA